ncbi:MAG: helicase, partial [Candidatus Cloacimonadota bacterium]
VLSIVPNFLSNPRQKTYAMDVIDTIRKVILSTRRGTLILFTSYKMLNMAFNNLVQPLHENGITLLAQGRTGSRALITKEFKEIADSVLLGTYSFWEGIDIPGKALQNLIITKLPFPVPKEPIMEARAERLETMGLNPFNALFIPEAIIKLRQGFGRLMRAKDDGGIILVLDNRLINRDYGKRFLDSLPMRITISYSEEDFLNRISTFWKKQH